MLWAAEQSPVPGFPIRITPKQREALGHLVDELRTSHSLNLDPIHSFSYLLMSDFPKEFYDDDSVCVLNRFIILFHLQRDATIKPSYNITPNLSSIQWFFRFVGAYEAYRRRHESEEGMYG